MNQFRIADVLKSFFPRTIPQWNSLHPCAVTVETTEAFKTLLYSLISEIWPIIIKLCIPVRLALKKYMFFFQIHHKFAIGSVGQQLFFFSPFLILIKLCIPVRLICIHVKLVL